MDRLRLATVVALNVIAFLAGGALFRMVMVIGDFRAGITVLAVMYAILVGVAAGAKGYEWTENPYW